MIITLVRLIQHQLFMTPSHVKKQKNKKQNNNSQREKVKNNIQIVNVHFLREH